MSPWAASHKSARGRCGTLAFARLRALAWSVLQASVGGMPGVAATRTLLLVGSAAALAAALVATSGVAGPRATQLLLALGAMVALTLVRASSAQKP